MTTGKILIVDDEKHTRQGLSELLGGGGYQVITAANGYQAWELVLQESPDVVLADLKMPGMDGLQLLRKIKEFNSETPVIVITAHGTVKTAIEALKLGAEDYLMKPVNIEEMEILVRRTIEKSRLIQEAKSLRHQLQERYRFANLIGNSRQMQEIIKTIKEVADSRASILIQGESGTGKELVAKAIHYFSPRRENPFVTVSCAVLAETLLESEIFGHVRGAFTGAISTRKGRFEMAHMGTIFFDEIGEISPSTQVKLLRFLQEHEFERVGSNETIRVDVRVIAATNKDLKQAVIQGTFREDLFYRLNVIPFNIPPLRERKSDIPLFVQHFINKFAAENNKSMVNISPEALDILKSYHWPGNIRELENAVERAVVMMRNNTITPDVLPPLESASQTKEMKLTITIPPGLTMRELEKAAILQSMELANGSTSRAARMLGISVRKIQYKLKAYQRELES
ncbi:MAG: sigma-54-dependent Fis family transcriptional regulator [Deltaproteobacteria bacterium]|nr:sigma-54-dependent Fis family transcriptional regulator [Deltaproteobacteria bacterium]